MTPSCSANAPLAVWRWLAAIFVLALPLAASPQALPAEVQVGSAAILDYEFDWGRDGVYCPSCNFGMGNLRFSYVDNQRDVWVGAIDPLTGDFQPFDGRGTRLDRNALTAVEAGNGPEWMFSSRGSEVLYGRWTDGKPRTTPNLVMSVATPTVSGWLASSLPGSNLRILPIGTLDLGDLMPAIHYQTVNAGSLYWRDIAAADEHKVLVADDPQMTRRWVPGTRDIILTARAPGGGTRAARRQAFLYHTATDQLEQLTSDPTDKLWAFMWRAPEYDNEPVFFVVAGGTRLDIYRNQPRPDGTPRWRVVNSIEMPAATPYLISPGPFVHNGKSWVIFSLSASSDVRNYSVPSLIAITGIDPAVPSLRMLTSDTDPPRSRRDPEHFVTANGPYIYYNRYLPGTDQHSRINEGVFRVDTGLGPRLP